MSQIAKVFTSGNSQAVRLPKEFRLDVSEVDISREGEALILRPRKRPERRWSHLHEAIARGMEFSLADREQPGEQARPELDGAFK